MSRTIEGVAAYLDTLGPVHRDPALCPLPRLDLSAAGKAADVVSTARTLAEQAHAGQSYNGGPYTDHLSRVVLTLVEFGHTDPEILAAGWLHDALEDTVLRPDAIEDACGFGVVSLVWACTGVGPNRRARNALIAEKLRTTTAAIPIKVADRIANVSACWESRDGRLFMYRNEHADFRRAVLTADPAFADSPMLARLDALLSFRA